MTFMDDYWAGRTDGCTIQDYIKAYYDDDTLAEDLTLAEYLGMTRKQYQAWYWDHELPERGAP